MVRVLQYFLFFSFFVFTTSITALDVTVTAEIDSNGIAGEQLRGAITITHDDSQLVIMDSFKLEGKALKVEYLKKVRMSPSKPLIISIYQFDFPGGKKGLHILPEVSVTVGEKEYKSIPSTYELKEPSSNQSGSTAQVVLGLQPFIDGKRVLYPGQRVRVGYRYLFNYSFDLSKEIVPLLEAKGFRKIGDKVFNESTRDNLTTLEVSQLIEAVTPGDYSFGPSEIMGRAYILDSSGKKQSSQSEFRAESPPISITVVPIPERGRPTSFNGAIGDYTFDLTLQSSPNVAVGDKLILAIKITGEGELENLPMPEVCCQPGFSGVFKTSDLPPVGTISGDSKTFIVEIRPISERVKEIPSLEFSFFSPDTITFETLKSKPISIIVTPIRKDEPVQKRPVSPSKPISKPSPPSLSAIEIEGNFSLTGTDLQNKPFSSWWVLLMIPFGIGALIYQKKAKKYIEEKKPEIAPKTSGDLFREALQMDQSTDQFFSKLHDAIVLRLEERGALGDALELEAKDFLVKLEEIRYAGKGDENIIAKAMKLFDKLR